MNPRIIDVHHHFEPTYKNLDGTAWSPEIACEELDRNAISAAIGYAGPVFPDAPEVQRKKARELNEWSAGLCSGRRGRFGFFASIPMSDVGASLSEIAHAFDVLHCQGVGISTSYGEAWLGDVTFRPIFEELNRRSAVVFVHPGPGAPSCSARSGSVGGAISPPWLEFPVNTARTILSLLTSGTVQQFPDIKFIFCHGGGVMPSLLGRIAGFSAWSAVGPERLKALFSAGIYAEFAKLYFECAQAYAPENFEMLLKVAPPSHLLFGTDYSYFPIAHSVECFGKLRLPDDVRRLIQSENALALFPDFA